MPTPEETNAPTEAAPQAVPPASTLPACDDANPLAAQESTEFYSSIDVDVTDHTGPTDLTMFNRLSGPIAQAAMQQVGSLQGCEWPLYLAGNHLTQYSATLDTAAMEELVSGLRESDYSESGIGSVVKFELVVEDPTNYRMAGQTTIQQLFVGDIWIAIFETGKSDYSQSALDAMFAQNPHLLEAETR